MSKPILLYNQRDLDNPLNTLGMTEIIRTLINSGEFEVGTHDEKVRTMKNFRACLFHYNGKRVYVDFWEYSTPAHTMPVFEKNFDLIIKLQHKDMSPEAYERSCQKKNILLKLSQKDREEFLGKIIPWTFFPSRIMGRKIGSELELQDSEVKEFGFFCGKGWRGRRHMRKKLENEGIEFIGSDNAYRSKRRMDDNEYLQRMRGSKFGIVLKGRCSHVTEAKNRREIDYMMLKKPILIDYKPFYYNSLENGKHYIYVDTKTDFKSLESMYNIDEIANNGYQWYKDNASPEGIVKTFKQIMSERLGV